MSTYKCENPECGNVFKSNNPLSCPKCDTLEFSTIHIKSNKKFLVFGFLILLIGTGLFFLLNDESSNTESKETILKPVLELSESKIETISFTGGLMYSTTNLNVRMKPNKNSEKVTSLKLNTPVLTNTKDIGDWVLIADTDSNKLGYVHSNYLSEKVTPKAKITPKAKVKLKVGQKLYGGIIFYIDESGKHGLVAATEDLEGEFEWGCYGTDLPGADGQAIGTGYQNTLDIVAGCSETNTAAFNALNATIQGYSDWYLPSKDELKEMHLTIGKESENFYIRWLHLTYYWSSSEYFYTNARIVNFYNGNAGTDGKDGSLRVRCVRAF